MDTTLVNEKLESGQDDIDVMFTFILARTIAVDLMEITGEVTNLELPTIDT